MSKPDTRPREVKPGACSWCGHPPHLLGACRHTITTADDQPAAPCPCQYPGPRGES